jgi:hypothetical protein
MGWFLKIVFSNGSRADSTSAVRGNDVLDDAGAVLGTGAPDPEVDALGMYIFWGAGPQPTSKMHNVESVARWTNLIFMMFPP